MSAKQSMMLITSVWNNKKSFKLMPVSKECPFSEGIFDLDGKILVMMSANTKETLHMVPTRDENGDIALAKHPRKGPDGQPNGKKYKERQVTLETYTEFYMSEKQEIIDLINLVAINAESYNFKQYLEESVLIKPETPKIEIVKG